MKRLAAIIAIAAGMLGILPGTAAATHCQYSITGWTVEGQLDGQPDGVYCLASGTYNESTIPKLVANPNNPWDWIWQRQNNVTKVRDNDGVAPFKTLSVEHGASVNIMGGIDAQNGAINDVPFASYNPLSVAYWNDTAALTQTVDQDNANYNQATGPRFVDIPSTWESQMGATEPYPNPAESTRRIHQTATTSPNATYGTGSGSTVFGTPSEPWRLTGVGSFKVTNPSTHSANFDRNAIFLDPRSDWVGPGTNGRLSEQDFWQVNTDPTAANSWTIQADTGYESYLGADNDNATGYYPGFGARGSGIPIAPTTIRGIETYAGIFHAVNVTFPDSALKGIIAPATKCDSNCDRGGLWHYGARIKLKESYEIPTTGLPSGVTPSTQFVVKVVDALKTYGAVFADRGSNFELDFSRRGLSDDSAIPNDNAGYALAFGDPALTDSQIQSRIDSTINALNLSRDKWDVVCTAPLKALAAPYDPGC